MATKRAIWMGDKETVVKATSPAFIDNVHATHIHVMHRRKKNPKTGKIHHYGWIHFNRTGGGTIDSVREMRRLGNAILKSIGDRP
jgi:hypothetical protein